MRYCHINPQGEKVKVKLIVNNGLVSGGDFNLIEQPDKVIDNWKMKTNDTGEDNHEITIFSPSQLIAKGLKWEILTCCAIPGSNSGNLKLKFYQGETECNCIPPVDKNLKDLPQCNGGQAQPFNGGLEFKAI